MSAASSRNKPELESIIFHGDAIPRSWVVNATPHGAESGKTIQPNELVITVLENTEAPMHLTWDQPAGNPQGIRVYQQVSQLQHALGRKRLIGNTLRSTGRELDHDWIPFFKGNGWLVELDFDGPAHVHDHYRRGRKHATLHEQAERAARLLLANGVPLTALVAVNAYSVRFPEAIYTYLKRLGIRHLQLNYLSETESEADDRGIDAATLAPFLCELYDCWQQDREASQNGLEIRTFSDIHAEIAGREPSFSRVTLVVDGRANVYGRFPATQRLMVLGNLSTTTLGECLSTWADILAEDPGARTLSPDERQLSIALQSLRQHARSTF